MPHDVADRVERADLVEVDLLRLDAVDAAPRRAASAAKTAWARSRARAGQRRVVEQRADRRPSGDGMRGSGSSGDDRDVRARRCRAARDALAAQREPVDAERAAGRSATRAGVGAGVEQGAEQHVAGEAADGVDVEQPAHGAPAGGAGDARGDRAGAEAVVDVDDRDAGGAGGEHREQRGEPPNAAP